jgi:hypothetical protein
MGVAVENASKKDNLQSASEASAESPLLRAFAPLHKTAMGVAWGVVCGGVVAVATIVPLLRGIDFLSFGLLAQFFWGYSVSWPGIFIGLLWGFALGFALGYGFAAVRNTTVWLWLTVIRSRAEIDQYSDLLDHL